MTHPDVLKALRGDILQEGALERDQQQAYNEVQHAPGFVRLGSGRVALCGSPLTQYQQISYRPADVTCPDCLALNPAR